MKLSRYKNFESFVPKNLEDREREAEEKGLLIYPDVGHIDLLDDKKTEYVFIYSTYLSGIKINFLSVLHDQLRRYLFVRIEHGNVLSINFYDRAKKSQKRNAGSWKDKVGLGNPINIKFFDKEIAEKFFEYLAKRWYYEPLQKGTNKDEEINLQKRKEAIQLAKDLKKQMIKKAEENNLIAQ